MKNKNRMKIKCKCNVKRKKMLLNLTKEELNYIAGFIDGDGCILAQIVKRNDYKLKFQIRVSITFYQKTSRHWFLFQLHKKLCLGSLRKRNDGMSELNIVGFTPVKQLLIVLLPYLIIKKPIANLILQIIDKLENLDKLDKLDIVNIRSNFIEVCELVDKVAEFTDSKKRIINTIFVKKFWYSMNMS